MFVLTAEDIRRGGFTSLPEALRVVPGLFVAKVNARFWTISARGFGDYLNNKMLVLIDGRSVYTPLFGGVMWDQYDIPLDSIERIEVIRGPGGTLWGANAINGVINIITKSADKTQGYRVNASAGIDDGAVADVRYGGHVGTRLSYRVYGKASYSEAGVNPDGSAAYDFWNLSRAGIRADMRLSVKDDLTFESEAYEGREQGDLPYFSAPGAPQGLLHSSFVIRGGHVLARWQRRLSRGSTDLLAYCQWSDRLDFEDEVRNDCQVEFQHDVTINSRGSLIWGAGANMNGNEVGETFTAHGTPSQQRTTTVSAFAQYEFSVIPRFLRVIGGSKFERDPYTGFAIQPQLRAVLTPNDSHTLWAAVSRAVRTPDQIEHSEEYKFAMVPAPVPTYLTSVGNPDLKAESVRAYEFGYRFNPSPRFSIDAALFYNHYENLVNVNLADPAALGAPRIYPNPLYVEIPVLWRNLGNGQTHGAELYTTFRPSSRWLLATGLTELRGGAPSVNSAVNAPQRNTPQHQFNFQSRTDLSAHLELDAALYHYNGIPGYDFVGVPYQDVPTHNRLDAGLSWHRADGFSFSVWGRDLGSGRHWENRPPLFTATGSQVPGQSLTFAFTYQSAVHELH
jgi:iron complex outermembrane receptor protein